MFAVHFLSPYDYVQFAYLELMRHIQERLKKKLKIKKFLLCDFNKLRYLTCTYEKLLLNFSSGSILRLEVNSSGSRRNNRHDRSGLLHFYFAPRFIHLSVRNYCIQVFCAS